jgi:hypothetical protein
MLKNSLVLFSLIFVNLVASQVFINEIDTDTPSTDQLEFVELKSAMPNFPLDGYVLVFFNETNSSSYYAIDLDGYTTDFNGIFHVGNNLVSPTPFKNFPISTIQNGPDVIALYFSSDVNFPLNTLANTNNLIDSIAYKTQNAQANPVNLMGIFGLTVCTNENANGLRESHSIQRRNDGTYEVKSPTPGMNNDGSGIVPNYITVSFPQTSFNEGDSFNITFTTSEPVQNENLIMNFTLANGNFTNLDFSGGLTVMIPVGQTTTQNGIIIANDGIDEGDEDMKFVLQSLPIGYVSYNNNMVIRVNDVNFATDPWGTPLNPTYNVVIPTIPAGYYDSLEGLSGAALKQAVQDIIANPLVVRAHNYGDIEFILKESDKNPDNSNQVWCMYVESPKPILDYQVGSSNIGVWNREHIFPQSRGGFSDGTSSTSDGILAWSPTNANDISAGHADAHHIRAEDGAENSLRSNRNYGIDYNGPAGNSGSWHGDVARSLFYMAVRYNGLTLVNGNPPDVIVGQIGDLATLLTWNTTDPRDDFEMNRNNYIYTWQMNRNPFIDYPLLANYIFGANFGQPWSASLTSQNPVQNKIVVYPNPAEDYLIISGLEGNAIAKIYTLTGQLIQCIEFENEIKLNLNCKAGMYLVTITNGSQTTTKKIIVK